MISHQSGAKLVEDYGIFDGGQTVFASAIETEASIPVSAEKSLRSSQGLFP